MKQALNKLITSAREASRLFGNFQAGRYPDEDACRLALDAACADLLADPAVKALLQEPPANAPEARYGTPPVPVPDGWVYIGRGSDALALALHLDVGERDHIAALQSNGWDKGGWEGCETHTDYALRVGSTAHTRWLEWIGPKPAAPQEALAPIAAAVDKAVAISGPPLVGGLVNAARRMLCGAEGCDGYGCEYYEGLYADAVEEMRCALADADRMDADWQEALAPACAAPDPLVELREAAGIVGAFLRTSATQPAIMYAQRLGAAVAAFESVPQEPLADNPPEVTIPFRHPANATAVRQLLARLAALEAVPRVGEDKGWDDGNDGVICSGDCIRDLITDIVRADMSGDIYA